MIISFKGNTGGGGYVLPTATDTRLGGVKVGSGLTVQNDGTLSADGGTGGGDYIVTEALSSITNPTEGMIAYVPAHYEDRGATYIKYELNDTSENVDFWSPTFISIDNFYEWAGIRQYIFNATNNEKSSIAFDKIGGYDVTFEANTSTEWLSPSYGSKVLVRMSGATLEFLVNSGLTVSTNNPDDKFTITTSTGLTPVRGMTYVYHSGWLLKNVDFAYDRVQDYLPSLIHMSLNPEIQSEFNFILFRYKYDYVLWFGMDAQGNPGGWARFEFRCVEADGENRLQRFSAFVDSEAGNPWRFFAEVSDYIKDLDFIRIPVLCEDAVLSEDIEYEGQIVAHSGDTVASAGTIVDTTDLLNQSDYWEEYRKHRIVFQFVKPGYCYWNNDLQKVIVDQGEEVKSYSDVLNLQYVPSENDEDKQWYMSSIMNYNGILYRGNWKQEGRYTRWITLSWETIMNHWVGTQAQYNALAPNYDNNTLYVIV